MCIACIIECVCVCVCVVLSSCVTLSGLVGQVNDVVSSFSGDIYGIVDQTISVSQGECVLN